MIVFQWPRSIALIGLLLLILFLAMRAMSATDPRAVAIVHLLEEHYHNVNSLQGIFLERYSDARNSAAVESGTVYFSRPGRMRWDYESPEKKLFLSDGK